MTNYNGWTNYATWRVNLEIFDGIDPEIFQSNGCWDDLDVYSLADVLKEYANELVGEMGKGLVVDYASAFLDEVNWREIAQSMIETYSDEEAA